MTIFRKEILTYTAQPFRHAVVYTIRKAHEIRKGWKKEERKKEERKKGRNKGKEEGRNHGRKQRILGVKPGSSDG